MATASRSRPGLPHRPQQAPALLVRERILEGFAVRARAVGVRGVVMADLAADLGMSKKTLYLHFVSKDELVLALVQSWAMELENGARRIRARARAPLEFFREVAALWVDSLAQFSSAFWAELQHDHPAAHAAFVAVLEVSQRRTRERIGPHLRSGVPQDVALEILNATIARAADPAVAARLGISTRDALISALDVWARGALRAAPARHRPAGSKSSPAAIGSRKAPLFEGKRP